MAFRLFGKKNREPEPPKVPFTIGRYRVFRCDGEGDPVAFAAEIAREWTLPFAGDADGPVGAERVGEEVEFAADVSDVAAFIVDEETGSLGETNVGLESEEDGLEEEDIIWLAVAVRPEKTVCPGCGAPVKPENRFCENCGRKLK